MILLDATYINRSGGLELLSYLVECLFNRKRDDVFYLFDLRCVDVFSQIDTCNICFIQGTESERRKFYISNRLKFDKILCFGNVPPPVHMYATVYTYSHNIYLFSIPKSYSFSSKIKTLLKRYYINSKKKHTDCWIVQTSNVEHKLHLQLGQEQQVLVLPFYKIDKSVRRSDDKREGYVYIANYLKEKNHGLLLQAWIILAVKGFYPRLQITIEDYPEEIEILLIKAKRAGANIINHGKLPKSDVYKLYNKSCAAIYTSCNESFGLGIVEALEYGCDVLGPNVDYINSICKPSITFDLDNIDSIVHSVIVYERGECLKSRLLIRDNINELINLLV